MILMLRMMILQIKVNLFSTFFFNLNIHIKTLVQFFFQKFEWILNLVGTGYNRQVGTKGS